MRPNDSQIGLLSRTIKYNFAEVLPDQIEEHASGKNANMKYVRLEEWAREQDKYAIGSFINILTDEDLDHEWREDFCAYWLNKKGYAHV
jgi:hypothetical protein